MNNYCPYDGGICYSSGCYFLSTPPICSKQATKSIPSEDQPKSEAKELEIKAEKYANRVLDTRKRSGAFIGYISGYRAAQEEITRLKAELEKERELRKELAWNDAIDAVKDMLVVQMEDEENEGLAALHNAYRKLEELKHKHL